MCGISGFVDPGLSLDPDRYGALADAMANALLHRGPDGGGSWIDAGSGVALSHRRLAVIDVSDQGQQPKRSRDGRCVLTYNGEIYNFQQIRADLSAMGRQFSGTSDTEVLVEALAYWGLDATLSRLNGIFAFALWEVDARRLTLVRDPLGVKPLYWGQLGGRLVFGSELKALRAFPDWRPEIDRDAVAQYLRYGYVPAPRSIYRGIAKLRPGCYVVWDKGGGLRERRYWDLGAIAADAFAHPVDMAPHQAVDTLHDLLYAAVGAQLVSDVPIGGLLSGGVDSSAIAALMQAQSARPIKTYTIGFSNEDYDEARAARAVAEHLGTEHHELYVKSADLLALVPRLPEAYDEPFADASQLPTMLVARLARQSVTVALSGDGGDELFAGYNRHLWAHRWWPRLARVPVALRRAAAGLISAPGPGLWHAVGRSLPGGSRVPQLAAKAAKLSRAISQPDLDAAYRELISYWTEPYRLLVDGPRTGAVASPPRGGWPSQSALARLQLADALGYLPDNILTKLDRASMAYALEARVPLLDPRLVAFAWRLPDTFKIRAGQSKWLLRQVLYRYVPRSLIERPKMGFSVPIDDWLRGPLRDWAEALLAPQRFAQHNLLEPTEVHTIWQAHQKRRVDAGQRLWNLLCLRAWLDCWA